MVKIYKMDEVEVYASAGISLSIEPGEMVAIMGPSGSGKSTLLNIIGCLDKPSLGSYRLDGQEVSKLNDNQLATIRNRKLGFVFQTFNLLPRITALVNVELPLVYGGGANRRQRALEALARVEISDRVHHKPSELSGGGEQQRVAIARALVTNVPIILADKTICGLDFETGRRILQLLSQICQEQKERSFLVVTHNAAISQMAHRVIRMKDGRVVENHQNTNPVDPEKLQW